MRYINGEELNKILKEHEEWLKDNMKGQRADLWRADLSGVDLSNTDLKDANLRFADLVEANLTGAILKGADLTGADLYHANLSGADLRYSNLFMANLNRSDLSGADLWYSNLCLASLDNHLDNVKTDSNTKGISFVCPKEGSFIGYKKVKDYIIKLEIPTDAKRSSATTRKCRCNKAKVISITNKDVSESGLTEIYNRKYNGILYKIGETSEVNDFNENRWNECSTGIHFFMTREEAVNY